jgi:hypothetical protein
VLHAFALSAIPKNFSGLRIRELDLKGKTSAKLDLVKEKLNRFGSGHSQRGKNSLRLGFDSGSDPSPDGGGFQHELIVAQL